MSYRLFSSLAVLPLFAIACGSASEEVHSSSQDISSAWLDTYLPAGSPAETKVLALVNDAAMTSAKFVSECGISQQAADAIVAYRNGDDTTTSADNQRFDSAKELDALPFTDNTFWNETMSCAVAHVAGPPVCVPGHAPVIIELVVDESGSMSGDKWIALRGALLSLYRDMSTAADKDTYVGLVSFDDQVNTKVAPKPLTDDHQLDSLIAATDKPQPHGGGTGTLKALTTACSQVSIPGVSTQAGARRIVVLLSDGSPSGGPTEQQQALDLVTQQYTTRQPNVLYSVGIGPFPSDSPGGYDPTFMGKLALAGGSAPPGCDPASTDLATVCHYQMTPGGDVVVLEQSFVAALTAIRNSSGASNCP